MTDEKENRQGVGKGDMACLERRKTRLREPGTKGFLPGHPGGPGRPPRDVELTYISAIYEKVSIDDWKKVIEKALIQAKAGDKDARNYLHNALGADQELWMGVEPTIERVEYWIKTLTERAAKQKQLEAAEQEGSVIDVQAEKKD